MTDDIDGRLARLEELRAGAPALMPLLDPFDEARLRALESEVARLRATVAAPRGGALFRHVVALFAAYPCWTVADLRVALAAEDVVFTDKQLYNALGLLARRGRVVKRGYGDYARAGTPAAGPTPECA
jgi:hypothetical protein